MSSEQVPARPPRPVVALVVAGLLAALLPLVAALPSRAAGTLAPAAAAVPVAPRTFGPAIDGFASYQGQSTCSPAAKPGASKLASLLRTTYGSYSIGISRDCSVGGQSEHKEGRALDWMVNAKIAAQKAKAEAFLSWLLATDQYGNVAAMARRLGVMYIGWNNKFWRGYDVARGWTELKGCLTDPAKKASGYDSYCHRNHVHISLTWEGAMALTSFWSGVPLPGPCLAGWAPAQGAPVPGGDLRLVTPVRVLDTRTGTGLEEPCRLSAPRWSGDRTDLVVDVTGVGEVPDAGVAAVALRVHATRGSAQRYTVSARATADQPAVPLLSTALTAPASGTVVVPVAADGTVRLVLDAGTTDVLVDVLGWAPAAAPAVPTRVGTAGAMRLVSPFAVEDAWTTPLKPKEIRTIALAGRGGLPASGLTGLTFSVEAGTTSAPALVDVLRTDPRSQVGRVRTSTSTAAVSLVVSPTVDGTIQLRNLSSVAVPLRLRVFAWSGTGAGGRSLVVGTTPVPVVDTTKGLGLTGAAPSRTGRSVTVTGNAAAPTGATAVLVSVSTYGGSTAGVAAVKGRYGFWVLDTLPRTWIHSIALVPLSGSTLNLATPAGAHARMTVLGYVA